LGSRSRTSNKRGERPIERALRLRQSAALPAHPLDVGREHRDRLRFFRIGIVSKQRLDQAK